jgi:hypothetical protein
MLRVVGSGRRARGDEAKRHDEAFRRAGELLTRAESFDREPLPSHSESGESGSPDANTSAESVDPDIVNVRALLAQRATTPKTTVATSAFHQTLHEALSALEAVRASRAEALSAYDEAAHAWVAHRLLVGEAAPANLRKRLLAEWTKTRREQSIPELKVISPEDLDRILRLGDELRINVGELQDLLPKENPEQSIPKPD